MQASILLLLLVILQLAVSSEPFIDGGFFQTPKRIVRAAYASENGHALLYHLQMQQANDLREFQLSNVISDENVISSMLSQKTDIGVVNQLALLNHPSNSEVVLANLKSSPINLIATDDSGLVDMTEFNETIINTCGPNSIETTAAKILFKNTSYSLNHELDLTNYGKTYHVLMRITQHPNRELEQAFDGIKSHYLTLKSINHGGFYVSFTEKPFFSKHPYFSKINLDLIKLQQFYPKITIYDRLRLYVPTLSTRNLLLGQQGYNALDILRVLYQHRTGISQKLELVSVPASLTKMQHPSVNHFRNLIGLNRTVTVAGNDM